MNTSIAKCVSTVQTVRVLYGAVIEMAAHEVSNVFHRGHFVTVLSPDVTRTADLGGRKRERERDDPFPACCATDMRSSVSTAALPACNCLNDHIHYQEPQSRPSR